MSVNQLLYGELQRIARTRGIRGYTEVAPLVGLDMALEKDRATISAMLDEISTSEHERGRPLLSALVVHRIDGNYELPGKGFFTLRRRLGLRPADDDETFWSNEVSNIHNAWATQPR
jgi:hypothetical protein